ncbi:hypothetical protein PCANC_07685 [Puccinia coronata f. sp. avenae]|uniref:Uncharacterized protein n=1 Tax=Puccinia coronata f. sp. avenae TaxID=200324 RepID=A0A2N5VR99_9BASI|nr:hypothetical protein PCANC_07685 [Puccinia coronata f. sp. avenae]
MTAKADCLIHNKTGTRLNLCSNHIRCVCHKVALILNAGLKELNLGTQGLTQSKQSTLGYVPKLLPIAKESEETADLNESNVFEYNEKGPLDDQSEAEANSDNEINCNRPSTPPSATNPQNPIAGILKKVNFVIQRITLSSSKRLEFEVWEKKLNYEGPNLIAGYGICWNVKWKSRDRAYQGRNVINKLIKNERD